MFHKNETNATNETELNQLITSAENEPTGQTLFALADKLEPRTAYLNDLEQKLRGAGERQLRSPFRWKSLMLAGAALVLLGVVVAFFWLNRPAPVSAQEVLSRAASPQLPSNAFIHRVYSIEGILPTQSSGNAEAWLQTDGTGSVARTAYSITYLYLDDSPHEIQRTLIDGDSVKQYDYNPSENAVQVIQGSYNYVFPQSPNLFDGASVAKFLGKIASGQVNGFQLLTQSFMNRMTYGVRLEDNGETTTFYFDAQTYIMLGVDNPETRVRLMRDEVVEPSQVPSAAFDFVLPPNAHKVFGNPFSSGQGDQFNLSRPMLAKLCNIPVDQLYAAINATKTPLAACQEGNPALTGEQLVNMLLVPYKAKFDAAVKLGNLTRDAETEQLDSLQKEMQAWVTQKFLP